MRLLSESVSVEIGRLINNIFSSERFIWQLDHEIEFLIGALETKLWYHASNGRIKPK